MGHLSAVDVFVRSLYRCRSEAIHSMFSKEWQNVKWGYPFFFWARGRKYIYGLPSWLRWKRISLQWGNLGSIPGVCEDTLEKEYFSFPYSCLGKGVGRLQCMGSQRVRYDWGTNTLTLLLCTYIHVIHIHIYTWISEFLNKNICVSFVCLHVYVCTLTCMYELKLHIKNVYEKWVPVRRNHMLKQRLQTHKETWIDSYRYACIWLHGVLVVACGIWFSDPDIEPGPLLSCWTIR